MCGVQRPLALSFYEDPSRVDTAVRTIRGYGRQRGLTLLEMLVVVILLAATAAIATSTFQSAHDSTHENLARSEMVEIVKAIRQFKADTGYYPGQGPFALVGDDGNATYSCADDAAGSAGAVDPDSFDTDPYNVAAGAVGEWFTSPANLVQLFEAPVICAEHAFANVVAPGGGVASWNPNSGRGWRGPYLNDQREYVDVGDGLGAAGDGDPTELQVAGPTRLELVRGIADPFVRRPVVPGGYANCSETAANDTCLLDWRLGVGNPALERHGRPYLLFLDTDDGSGELIEGCGPCLVSMGPNGMYDQGGDDDLVFHLE